MAPDVRPGPSAEVMDYAQRWVRATYAELPATGLLYSASVSGAWNAERWRYDSVEVQVNNGRLVTDVTSMEDLARILLNVVLKFDARGLSSVSATGSHLAEAKRMKVMQAFEEPGPRDLDRVRRYLRAAGARYVDDENAARARVPVAGWAAIFGDVRVGSMVLSTLDPTIMGGDPTAGRWKTTITVARPAGAQYDVYIEPFEGRVVRMSRKD